jgi:hypothetical protein
METQIGKPLASWLRVYLTGWLVTAFRRWSRTATLPTSHPDELTLSSSVAMQFGGRPLLDARCVDAAEHSHLAASDVHRRNSLLVETEKIEMSNATKSKSSKESKNRPVHDVRLGRIRAAIWQNETDNGTFYNVTVSRLYKDGDDWKDSASFGRDDLPLVAKVCDLAHTWIFEHGSKSNGNGDSGNGHDDERF